MTSTDLQPDNPRSVSQVLRAATTLACADRWDEADRIVEAARRHHPNDPGLQRALNRIRDERRKRLPGILINCLPKSASEYLRELLAQCLEKRIVEPTGGRFPDNRVRTGFIAHAYRNGWLMRGHISPNRHNLIEVDESIPKMVLHVRDPRASLLSLYHQLHTFRGRPEQRSYFRYYGLDETFFNQSEERQLDWMIDTFFRGLVSWIDDWLDAVESKELSTVVHLTTFESFVQDRSVFVEDVLRFLDIDPVLLKPIELKPRSGVLNFRRGAIDEWRDTMSSEQRSRLTNAMPERMTERFAWPRE